MAMQIEDLSDLIRLLEQHPEWRSQLRRALLSDELLELPDLVREIAEIQRRHSEMLAEHSQAIARLTEEVRLLAEAQRRTEQRVEELAQELRALAEAQRRTDERLEQLAEAQRRTEQRVEELAQELRALAETQRRTDERLEQLAEAQRRTDERLEQLAEAQRRTDERLEQLAEAQRRTEQRLDELTQALNNTNENLNRLIERQRGEAGRREGEQYEERTLRRAPLLFAGGDGGSPIEPHIRRLISEWLMPIFVEQRELESIEDPTLTDIIWWKGEKVLVVEVSIKVNGEDIARARRLADVLREIGLDATPVVIGEEWASMDTPVIAREQGVEWMVGKLVSDSIIQFRKLRPETLEAPRIRRTG